MTNEDLDDLFVELNSKIGEIEKGVNDANQANESSTTNALQNLSERIQVEITQTDALGNIPDSWGTFDGNYAKWPSFRDTWLATLHNKPNVSCITKLRALKKACTRDARGALGEWDLTDENYKNAWAKLNKIYDNHYMQVHQFMRQLRRVPKMNATSKSVRDIMDIVQKHIHGVKNHIKQDATQPYAVFAVIDSMDGDTYRAWEKHRPSLAKAAQALQPEQENQSETLFNPKKNTFQLGQS